MIEKINKIPAGMILVPMLFSALLYTFFPSLFQIGGMTEAVFGGKGMPFIIGAICFCSGTGIDMKKLVRVMKRQGILLILKLVISIVIGIIILKNFGDKGILGISSVALIAGLSSSNPALYLSLVNEFGTEDDTAAFGLLGVFGLPAITILVYSISFGGSNIDFTPVISTLLPLIIGIILGNIDKSVGELFAPAVGIFIPFIGWNLGQGLNLLEAIQAILPGILLALLFYLINSPLFLIDKFIMKNDGIGSLAMFGIGGVSASIPIMVAQTYQGTQPYVSNAASQILAAMLVTAFLTPYLLQKLAKKVNFNKTV